MTTHHVDQERIDSWDKYLKELQFKRNRNCGTLPPEFYPNYDETVLCHTTHSTVGTSAKMTDNSISRVASEHMTQYNAEHKRYKRSKTTNGNCMPSDTEKVKKLKERLYYHTSEVYKIKQMLKELDIDNNNNSNQV